MPTKSLLALVGAAVLASHVTPAAAARRFGPQRVDRLECAGANESVETGTASGTSYCQTIFNDCGSPVALRVVDQSTHAPSSTGQVEVHESGKVCTSHPNAVDYYLVYPAANAGARAEEGGDRSSWNGVTVKSWTCSFASVIGSDGGFDYSSISGHVTLRVNGLAQTVNSSGNNYTGQSVSRAEARGNTLVVTETHQQGNASDGVYLRETHVTRITRSGSTCSCSYTTDRTWQHGRPQHFSGGDTYACR